MLTRCGGFRFQLQLWRRISKGGSRGGQGISVGEVGLKFLVATAILLVEMVEEGMFFYGWGDGFWHARVVGKISLFKPKSKSTNNQTHYRKFSIPAFINRNFLEIFNGNFLNNVYIHLFVVSMSHVSFVWIEIKCNRYCILCHFF